MAMTATVAEREAGSIAACFTTGDRVRVRTPGGGGYGNPSDRDQALMEEDVRLGRYTPEHSRQLFGR